MDGVGNWVDILGYFNPYFRHFFTNQTWTLPLREMPLTYGDTFGLESLSRVSESH